MSAINCSDRSAHADMIKFHQSDSDLASSYRLSLPIPVWTSIQLSVMPYSHSWRKMCLKKSLIITSQFFKSAHKRWRKKRKKKPGTGEPTTRCARDRKKIKSSSYAELLLLLPLDFLPTTPLGRARYKKKCWEFGWLISIFNARVSRAPLLTKQSTLWYNFQREK